MLTVIWELHFEYYYYKQWKTKGFFLFDSSTFIIFLYLFTLLLLYWGYIVTFTKVLTIYHS
jgi:hypothetical protein